MAEQPIALALGEAAVVVEALKLAATVCQATGSDVWRSYAALEREVERRADGAADLDDDGEAAGSMPQGKFHVDPPVAVEVIRRLDAGWELYERDGRPAWYKGTRPIAGFDAVAPTPAEVTLILRSRFGHTPEPSPQRADE